MFPFTKAPWFKPAAIAVGVLVISGIAVERFVWKPYTEHTREYERTRELEWTRKLEAESKKHSEELLTQQNNIATQFTAELQRRDTELSTLKQQMATESAFNGLETRLQGNSTDLAPLLAILARDKNASQLPIVVNSGQPGQPGVPQAPVSITIRNGEGTEKSTTNTDQMTKKTTDVTAQGTGSTTDMSTGMKTVKVDEMNKTKIDEMGHEKEKEKEKEHDQTGEKSASTDEGSIGLAIAPGISADKLFDKKQFGLGLTYDLFRKDLKVPLIKKTVARVGAGPWVGLHPFAEGEMKDKLGLGVQANISKKRTMFGVFHEFTGTKTTGIFFGRKL